MRIKGEDRLASRTPAEGARTVLPRANEQQTVTRARIGSVYTKLIQPVALRWLASVSEMVHRREQHCTCCSRTRQSHRRRPARYWVSLGAANTVKFCVASPGFPAG
jgi:hypothetical protein